MPRSSKSNAAENSGMSTLPLRIAAFHIQTLRIPLNDLQEIVRANASLSATTSISWVERIFTHSTTQLDEFSTKSRDRSRKVRPSITASVAHAGRRSVPWQLHDSVGNALPQCRQALLDADLGIGAERPLVRGHRGMQVTQSLIGLAAGALGLSQRT